MDMFKRITIEKDKYKKRTSAIPGRKAEGGVYDNAGVIELVYLVTQDKAHYPRPKYPGVRVEAGFPIWVDIDNMEILGEGFGLLLRELYEYLDHLDSYSKDDQVLNALLGDFLMHDWGRHE